MRAGRISSHTAAKYYVTEDYIAGFADHIAAVIDRHNDAVRNGEVSDLAAKRRQRFPRAARHGTAQVGIPRFKSRCQVNVYLPPMTENRTESPGSRRRFETIKLIVLQSKTSTSRTC
jgi:hypothetical protein